MGLEGPSRAVLSQLEEITGGCGVGSLRVVLPSYFISLLS